MRRIFFCPNPRECLRNIDPENGKQTKAKKHIRNARKLYVSLVHSPLCLTAFICLLLAGILLNDVICYENPRCPPSRTTYDWQTVVLVVHLLSFGLFARAYVRAVEIGKQSHQIAAILLGTKSLSLLLGRCAVEIIYIKYHREDYINDFLLG